MVSLTKITFGINVPYQSTEIDWDATKAKEKETHDKTGEWPPFFSCTVRAPCIKIHREMFFALCDICGAEISSGRKLQRITTCSPKCNHEKNRRWCEKTEKEERESNGTRPTYFWFRIRNECFERDNYKCQFQLDNGEICGKDIRLDSNPGEAHHIVPVSQGGSNKLDNLKTLCYDCHKSEHSRVGNIKRQHHCLEVD